MILLCGQRMNALETRACGASPHLVTLFASLPPPFHIASLQPGTPLLGNLWDSTANNNTWFGIFGLDRQAKGIWLEHGM